MKRLAWYLSLAGAAAMPLFAVRFSVAGLPSTLLEALILAATAATAIAYRRSLERLPWYAGLAALWLVVGLVSALHAPDTWAGLGLWRAYFLEPILLGWCIWMNLRPRAGTQCTASLRCVLIAAIASGTAVALYAIFQKFTGYGIPHPWQAEGVRRVTSWLGYPNAVALLVAPLTWLAVAVGAATKERWLRFSLWGAGALMALAVLLAISEGGLIGLAAGGVAFGLLYSKAWRRVTLALLIAAAVAVAAVPSWRGYAVRTATLNDCPTLYECSLSLRRTQWVDTVAMLRDGHAIYGSGLGGYQAAMLPYHNHRGIEIYLFPHNVFLNFWTETGLAGLILFLGILVAFWFAVARALRAKSRTLTVGAAAAMATLLVHGLVDVPYFKNDLAVLFWLITLVPILALRIDVGGEKT